MVRAALAEGVDVRPVPGASAPLAALTVSGLPTDSFLYLGYLPHKTGERRARLHEVERLPYTLIFLESPYRITETLADMLDELGDRRICVAREMTKLFEEYWRGTVRGALEHFNTQAPRGEFTLVLAGAARVQSQWADDDLEQAIKSGLEAGESTSQLSKRLSSESGRTRREIYRRIEVQKNRQS